jgi:hypothetical protein
MFLRRRDAYKKEHKIFAQIVTEQKVTKTETFSFVIIAMAFRKSASYVLCTTLFVSYGYLNF